MIGRDLHDLLRAWARTQDDLAEKFRQVTWSFEKPKAKELFEKGVIKEQEFQEWIWHLIAFEGVQRILADIYNVKSSMFANHGPA